MKMTLHLASTFWQVYKYIPFPESMTAEPTFPKKPAIAIEQLRNPSIKEYVERVEGYLT